MAKKIQRQWRFEPSDSGRRSGMKVGDVLEVISVVPLMRRGNWWQPEVLRVRLVPNKPKCEACDSDRLLNRDGLCAPCARLSKKANR